MRLSRLALTAGLIACSSFPVHAQITPTVLAPAQLDTSAPNGPAGSAQLAVGALEPFVIEKAATFSGGPGLDAIAGLVLETDGYAFTLRGDAVTFTSASPSNASITGIDLLLDVAFPSPSYAQVVLDTPDVVVSGNAALELLVDVGDDGTTDYTVAPGATSSTIQLPFEITSAAIRITGSLSANAASTASFDLQVDVQPIPRCTITTAAPNCSGADEFLTFPEFDGSLRFFTIAPPTPLLVFGLSTLSAPLPITSPIGTNCILMPFPDFVVPMNDLGGDACDFTLPRFDSPNAPLPFTFYVQQLTVDAGLTSATTGRALRITCP